MRIKHRIRGLMEQYGLGLRDMASILKTPFGTFEHWMRSTNDTQPPACMVLLLDLLEQSPEARKIAGIEELSEFFTEDRNFKFAYLVEIVDVSRETWHWRGPAADSAEAMTEALKAHKKHVNGEVTAVTIKARNNFDAFGQGLVESLRRAVSEARKIAGIET